MVNSSNFFKNLLAKMSSTSQKQQLIDFLNFKARESSPVRKTDLFNQKCLQNTGFLELFTNSGILSLKEARQKLFRLMESTGVSVDSGNVIFTGDFPLQINAIVEQFLREIDSQSNPTASAETTIAQPKAAVATAGGGAVCQRKTIAQPKAAVATAGGGAVCHTRPMTLAQFQEESQKKPNKPLTCLVCPHTKKDGSGTCKFSSCGNFHPRNSSVVVNHIDKGGKKILLAKVCTDFNDGSCINNNCTQAHLSRDEYANVVQKDQAYKSKKEEEGAKVSSQEKPKTSTVIVPSQVHLVLPSPSSASQASHHSNIDNLNISEGSSADSNDIFAQWVRFINEEESVSAAVSPPPRSYSPAVEVRESEDEEKGQ